MMVNPVLQTLLAVADYDPGLGHPAMSVDASFVVEVNLLGFFNPRNGQDEAVTAMLGWRSE